MSPELLRELEGCRAAEKEQALFYRALAAAAEERGDAALAERLQGLHADEQHHLSRLTARLLELGHRPAELTGSVPPESASVEEWEGVARRREHQEVDRYRRLLEGEMDDDTRRVVEEIAGVEQRHAEELGGKWTMA